MILNLIPYAKAAWSELRQEKRVAQLTNEAKEWKEKYEALSAQFIKHLKSRGKK